MLKALHFGNIELIAQFESLKCVKCETARSELGRTKDVDEILPGSVGIIMFVQIPSEFRSAGL